MIDYLASHFNGWNMGFVISSQNAVGMADYSRGWRNLSLQRFFEPLRLERRPWRKELQTANVPIRVGLLE